MDIYPLDIKPQYSEAILRLNVSLGTNEFSQNSIISGPRPAYR